MTRVAVVSAGLGVPSSTRLLADRLGAAVAALAPDVEIVDVELRPLAHALADRLLTGFAAGALADALDAVRTADAVIAVTPVFAASYSGLFKTFFDVVEPGSLEATPVLVAATAGSARHALVLDHALRPLFSHLRAVVVPTGVLAATADFADPALHERISRAAEELAALLPTRRALRAVPRANDRADDGLAASPPFDELLRRASGC